MTSIDPRVPPRGREQSQDNGAAPPRSLTKAVVAGALLILGGVLVVMAVLPRILSRETAQRTDAPGPATSSARRIQATLFYVSDDGAELIQVPREVLFGETPALQARHIVEAQLEAPAKGFVSAIPSGVKVRSLFLGAHGEAYVDLSPEIMTGHHGGSLDEALAVFAIVNAVTSNLPDVSAVQILVDGKEVDSLAGHIDLREPINRANAWIRKGQ
jgi:spore germination protein GerM